MDSGVALTMLDVLNRNQETEYVRCLTTLFLKKGFFEEQSLDLRARTSR